MLIESVSQKETFANGRILEVPHIRVYIYIYRVHIYIERVHIYIYIYRERVHIYNIYIYIEYIYVYINIYIYICRWYCFLLFLFPRSSSQPPQVFFSPRVFCPQKMDVDPEAITEMCRQQFLHFFRVETFDWKLWKHEVVSHEETHSFILSFQEKSLFSLHIFWNGGYSGQLYWITFFVLSSHGAEIWWRMFSKFRIC